MKRKAIPFNAEDLIRSVDEVRDVVLGRSKATLRTTKVPSPAPPLTAKEGGQIRAHLKVSQPVFAAILNVPTVTAISWEKGRRRPSGAALRLLEIARTHPELLAVA
jgi:putative transcriptional regulator